MQKKQFIIENSDRRAFSRIKVLYIHACLREHISIVKVCLYEQFSLVSSSDFISRLPRINEQFGASHESGHKFKE